MLDILALIGLYLLIVIVGLVSIGCLIGAVGLGIILYEEIRDRRRIGRLE